MYKLSIHGFQNSLSDFQIKLSIHGLTNPSYIYLSIHPSMNTSIFPSMLFFSPQKWNVSQTKIRVISTVLFILFGCLLFVTLPAVIFKHIEGWSALESIYFVVITLTTIGFGDFVAGEGERRHHEESSGEHKQNTCDCICIAVCELDSSILSCLFRWF